MKYFKLLTLSLILLCFVSNVTFGQNTKKKVKYVDASGIYISEKEFNKCLKSGYIEKSVEKDNLVVHYLVHNSYEGKLTETENTQIRLMIGKIVGKDIDSNRIIVIHLYNKNDDKLLQDINYKRYWYQVSKSRERSIKIYDSFLIGNKNSGIIPNLENHLYLDSYNFLNKTFFNNSDLDYNHVIIRPDRTYRIFLGFFDNLNVLDMS
ncbi:hypothetical protein [Formosa maritima]|uniref:Uncharacterized protein n=1 Tax=Formosa maritima TaxID=2592046 RepID=A0A5D0GIS6_9FLAO|nr:hypothetical protein [Formosa maritima]TYA58874.1 hypothetical protein FVF61_01620 [Formosa maritima]